MTATTLNLSIKSDITRYQECLSHKDYNIMIGLKKHFYFAGPLLLY